MVGKKALRQDPDLNTEKERIVREIREAERECSVARNRFDEALEPEQVDYAIYSLEAAEKKLDILIRKAKLLWGKFESNKEAEWGFYR
ncbi:DUF2508 family protein [Cohnella thermotolerans]|uniref:DUF2508 family protein n=1 Tax=Cohnella thermotolerans TaxID=329858 RepID=UPI00042A4E0E|nr:DUF2508 family protein [Cohnella thermotolerans]